LCDFRRAKRSASQKSAAAVNDRTIRAAFVRVNDAPTLRCIPASIRNKRCIEAAPSSSIQNQAKTKLSIAHAR
jgi:hypothetical protein